MIRSAITALLLTTGVFAMSNYYVGYPRAGTSYIAAHKDERKSIKPGSHYYYGSHYGPRSFHGGK